MLNATYASTNQISRMLGYEPFKIKYELCEIILCNVNEKLKNVGITVMDGPFFSIMPFGKTGYHSLTAVTLRLILPAMRRYPLSTVKNEAKKNVLQNNWEIVMTVLLNQKVLGHLCLV